jgi:hypothetical protein
MSDRPNGNGFRSLLAMTDLDTQVPCRGGVGVSATRLAPGGVERVAPEFWEGTVGAAAEHAGPGWDRAALTEIAPDRLAKRTAARLAGKGGPAGLKVEQAAQEEVEVSLSAVVREAAAAAAADPAKAPEILRTAATALRGWVAPDLPVARPDDHKVIDARIAQLRERQREFPADVFARAVRQLEEKVTGQRRAAAAQSVLAAVVRAVRAKRERFTAELDQHAERWQKVVAGLAAVASVLTAAADDISRLSPVGEVVLETRGPRETLDAILRALGVGTPREAGRPLYDRFRASARAAAEAGGCPPGGTLADWGEAIGPRGLAALFTRELADLAGGPSGSVYDALERHRVGEVVGTLYDLAEPTVHLGGRDNWQHGVVTQSVTVVTLPAPQTTRHRGVRDQVQAAFLEHAGQAQFVDAPAAAQLGVLRVRGSFVIGIEAGNHALLLAYAGALANGHVPHLLLPRVTDGLQNGALRVAGALTDAPAEYT